MTYPKREWMVKLDTGEYLHEWNGYTPSYAGCFMGNMYCLGGEEKFSHCHDYFCGIGDVIWWIKAELDKLTTDEQAELLAILKRNKETADFITLDLVKGLCKEVGIDENHTEIIYRLGNKKIMEIYKSNNKKELFDTYYQPPKVVEKIVPDYIEEESGRLLEEVSDFYNRMGQ